jgi:hypothetical protein
MDEVLAGTAEQMKNFAVTYLVSHGGSRLGLNAGASGACGQAHQLLCKTRTALVIRCPAKPHLVAHAASFLPPHHSFSSLSWCQVDISEVPDFNTMYELYDPCTVMFFFRNKHIMVDLGTGAWAAAREAQGQGSAAPKASRGKGGPGETHILHPQASCPPPAAPAPSHTRRATPPR